MIGRLVRRAQAAIGRVLAFEPVLDMAFEELLDAWRKIDRLERRVRDLEGRLAGLPAPECESAWCAARTVKGTALPGSKLCGWCTPPAEGNG